jgi:tetratricopeptide (TPR) repeat protein
MRPFLRSTSRILAGSAVVLLALSPARPADGKAADISPETLAQHPEVIELRQQVADSPEDARLHAQLGNLYADLGWDDLAMASYREAIRLDEDLYKAWTNLGTIQNKREQLTSAEKSFRRAVALQPRAALAHYNLGVVLDRQGRYEEALQSYKTAVTYEPELLDPAVNPQVVNNRHLTAIRLLTYLDEIGSASLPLEEIETDEATPAESEEDRAAPVTAAALAGAAAPQADGPESKTILGTLKMKKSKPRRAGDSPAPEAPPSPSPDTSAS